MSIAPTAEDAPYVLVIGSANVDVSVKTAVLPRPGETVIGSESLISLGGKGANQAVAAAACGAATHLVGRVGDDAFGRMVREGLQRRGVQLGALRTVAGATTGIATISVEDSSRNSIIVVPGANALLRPPDLDESIPLIRGAAVVVLQCEIPMATMYRVVELAAQSGTAVMLNPAPFIGLDVPRIAGAVTYLVPNETEAGEMAGHPVETLDQALECARGLQVRGMECVIITLGARGCVVADSGSIRHHAGHSVAAIDTTGAGDAFVGCLAASVAAGRSRDESVRRALLYSALSTTRRGAQDSYASAREFEHALGATGPA